MPDSIESVKPILTVIDDEGDLVISSTGPRGKEMAHAVLALANGARKAVVIQDGEMKVLKRGAATNGTSAGAQQAVLQQQAATNQRRLTSPALPDGPDVQDSFISDIQSGLIGEAAMGESPAPTPGPSDPVPVPVKKRKPVIYQDAAAPPAPELAEAEMDRLLAEAQQAEQEAAKLQEDQRFQRQQAVQAQVEPSDVVAQPAEAARPRRRERQLATTGRPCGRCGGGGQIQGEAGFVGACPVCHGEGQVKTWDRSLKVR